MELIKITDLTTQLGLSSRSLRYYEQVGLIHSVRPEFEKYRYFDAENIERLKQIMVLRKMQIPIKDIIRIYESEVMSTVVEVFVDRINAIDDEMNALTELKRIVSEFLQIMIQNGITKISALPLLYEEMDKQLEVLEERKTISYEELTAISEKLSKPADISIVDLASMRVLSSKNKESGISDPQEFFDYLSKKDISAGLPGRHEMFEYQNDSQQTIVIQKIESDFINDSPFADYMFNGGLFAVSGTYIDEDISAFHRNMIRSFDDNLFYEVDYRHGGGTRHESLVESVLSPDGRREKVSVFVAVKKRLPNASLYDQNEKIDNISAVEIEEANPVLWTKDVKMDKLVPILNPYYHVNDQGEAEYIPYIDKRLLSTDVKVKLPYRVDIEFKIDYESQRFGYGSTEGSMRFYHGENLKFMYGVNMDNNADDRLSQEAIRFNQPIFGENFYCPRVGKINRCEYNKLIWIVGEKHFAVIINDEVRYCGVNFPYMTADLRLQPSLPILLGSNGQGKIFLKSVRVYQLKLTPKLKIKEGALTMVTKQSNNILPNIHQLITMHYGENYWFNGCAKYVMECLGEPDYDYWFFAGLTGDNFAQVYAYNGGFLGESSTDYRLSNKEYSFIENTFKACGYDATFVPEAALRANREMYLQTTMAYIDKGIPVIRYWCGWHVVVGYENFGETLLCMTSDNKEPYRVSADELFNGGEKHKDVFHWFGWVFIGEKKEQKELKQIYHDAILNLSKLLTTKTDNYCFGAEAFRAWANDIENGKYEKMKSEEFNGWMMYTNYVCNLATNSGGCRGFLNKAQELNPDFTFLDDVKKQYRITGLLWNAKHEAGDGFATEYMKQHGNLPDNLEAISGGFNITLEALQDKTRRERIVSTIRKFADCMDEVVRILNENLK